MAFSVFLGNPICIVWLQPWVPHLGFDSVVGTRLGFWHPRGSLEIWHPPEATFLVWQFPCGQGDGRGGERGGKGRENVTDVAGMCEK